MKNRLLLTFLIVCNLIANSLAQTDSIAPLVPPPPPPVEVNLPNYQLNVEKGQFIFTASGINGLAKININGEEKSLLFQNGTAKLDLDADAKGKLYLLERNPGGIQLFHIAQRNDQSYRVRKIPLWLSIFPPLVAILLALIFREVIVSLFVGVWAGAFIAGGMRIESLYYFLISILEVVQKYVIQALNDSGHLSVIVFSLLIGGMVAIISRNGGMAGVVMSLSKYARSPRSTQFITWLLGVAIFFDDYANTLIVGNTMRSVTDKFKISREKLAYIVDSTAAPVAAVAFITTWIGAELGYIDGGIKLLEGFDNSMTPYAIFISSLKYSFYPILTLAFILIIIYTKRDYGAMYHAEKRARTTGQVSRITSSNSANAELEDLSPVEGAPLKWYHAVVPVSVVILMTIFGLVDTGMTSTYSEIVNSGTNLSSQSWGAIWNGMGALWSEDNPGFFMKLGKLIGNSDSYLALLWASLSGAAVAIIMTLSAKIMHLHDTINTLITGIKTMLPAVIILTMAWSLAITTQELYTAKYLTLALQDSLNPYLMPMIIFVLAALIAFSTGSSWSTMAILYPIAIPTTWAICQSQGMDAGISMELLLNVIATVLAASVLGDHCSPISDTTILSSLASDCNHIDHVRTQLPYALTVGGVSLVAGGLSTFLGGGFLVSFLLLLVSLAILTVIVLRVGKPVD